MHNDDRSGIAGSWSTEWKPNEPTRLDQLSLPSGVIAGAELQLGHIQAATTQSALSMALARAEGFVRGIESAGITSPDTATLQRIFEDAVKDRRPQVEAE